MAVKIWISTSSTNATLDANWSTGYAPASGDTIIFNGTGTAAFSTNITFAFPLHLIVEPAHSGLIGALAAGVATPVITPGGSLTMPAPVGNDSSAGSARVFVSFSTGSTGTVNIDHTATTGEGGLPPVCIIGEGITATVRGGNVAFAPRAGEAAAVTLIMPKGQSTNPNVYLGRGVTRTSIVVGAGSLMDLSDTASGVVRVAGGQYTYRGTGAFTSVTVDSGTAIYQGTGTATAVDTSGLFDASGSPGFTITNPVVRKGGTLNLNNGKPASIVCTNPIECPDGLGSGAANVILPTGMEIELTAI